MSEQKIVLASGIRPFQPKIGPNWANARSGTQTETFAMRLLAQRQAIGTQPAQLALHWLQPHASFAQEMTVWQLNQTAVTHQYQQHINTQLAQFAIRFNHQPHLNRHIQQMINQATLAKTYQTSSTFISHPQQVKRLHQQLKNTNQTQQTNQALTIRPLYQQNGRFVRQTVNTQLIERVFQQGRRVEPNGPQHRSQPVASRVERHFAHTAQHREQHQTHTKKTLEQVRTVAQEVINGKNGRFAHTTSPVTPTPLTNIDGIQLQALTDKIVHQIDQKIIAQRERMGKY